MGNIEKSTADQINELHRELTGLMKATVDKAIEIGGLLHEQKEALPHGEWIPWVESNLAFSERWARDYMRFYRERDRLKSARVADLSEARALLTDQRKPEEPQQETTAPDTGDDIPRLGDEWIDREAVEFYKDLYNRQGGVSDPEGSSRVKVSDIKAPPDNEISRLAANSEVISFRELVELQEQEAYDQIEQPTQEQWERRLHDVGLFLMDLMHHELHLVKAMLMDEIKKGDYSHIENHKEAIQECEEYLKEIAPWRRKHGYPELPVDRIVPLAQSRNRRAE